EHDGRVKVDAARPARVDQTQPVVQQGRAFKLVGRALPPYELAGRRRPDRAIKYRRVGSHGRPILPGPSAQRFTTTRCFSDIVTGERIPAQQAAITFGTAPGRTPEAPAGATRSARGWTCPTGPERSTRPAGGAGRVAAEGP